MPVFTSPPRPPRGRGGRAHPQASEAQRLLTLLIRGTRLHRWHIAAAVAVAVLATVIGLLGPALLDRDDASSVVPGVSGAGPAAPPAPVCGNRPVLGGGPRTPPAGAIRVPAGDNAAVNWGRPGAVYWFASGTHTLGPGQFAQIIAGRGATFTGAPGAVLDGRHVNLYAFGGYAANVTVSYLTVRNFGVTGGNNNQGVVNHNSAPGWTMKYLTVADNAGAGIMVGSRDTVAWNCLLNNQQYGFNAYAPGPSGPSRIVITHNEIAGNDTYDWEKRQPGCGCTGGGKFWDVTGAVVSDNWVHDNHSVGLWADTNNAGFAFTGNYISGNYGSGLTYEISYNALIKDNTFIRNGLGAGPANPGFPTGAIYLSESGSDSRVPGPYGKTFRITRNTFTDNWDGVILWENADRYCNSPANTSSGICTRVSTAATVRTCNPAHIARPPYLGDCRWKTQNVRVEDNVFNFDPARLGPKCTTEHSCGLQGVFSEYGTYPSWSPYHGTVVERHITFGQGNHFAANVYHGPWQFMVLQQGTIVDWAAWQAAPYGQDRDSSLNASGPP